MKIKQAKYLGSFPTLAKCPEEKLPEYAFIGRSNVGKSSLINMLCGHGGLAHVSKKPGKTQSINFFLIDDSWYLVDLPGYGYARRSKKLIASFGKMINDYISSRRALVCTFVLIDANVPPQPKDMEFLNWLGENSIPFTLVYTKTDRLTKRQLTQNLEAIRSAIGETWHELPPEFITSAAKHEGKEEILDFIAKTNESVLNS